jgi:hypothetical protein
MLAMAVKNVLNYGGLFVEKVVHTTTANNNGT